MKYLLEEIAKVTGAKLIGDGSAMVSYVITDSRTVSYPSGSVFVAIKTSRNDGHRYVKDLISVGVKSFIISDESVVCDGANFLVTPDPLKAMQKLAAYHRAKFNIPVLGVTGSNGKTIVKEWISQLIGDDKKVTRSPRSYNSQIGVPLSVLEIDEQTELAIIEAGISKPGEMDKLACIIKPTVGIFTHLGEAHQENFASLKEKCEQKLRLFATADVIIYGKDDKLLDIAVAQADLKAEHFTWGKAAGTTVKLLSAGNTANGYDIRYKYKNKEHELTLPFGDNASVENAMNSLCFMLWLGADPDEIAKRFTTLKSVAMRLEVKNGENGCLVINDSYNSDFDSLSIALDFLKSQAEAKKLKKTIILSDIFQSGKDTVSLYMSVAELLKNKAVERLIGVGPEISANANLFNIAEKSFYASTRDLLESNVLAELKNEAVLLKGARSFRFEDVSAKISSIVHQTTLEVDINAILHNVDYFRSFLKPETKMVHMVKANAYGSGDVAVSRALQQHGCDYLAVAVADEGATLRNEGISVPIIVMNPEIGGLGKIIDYHLEPEIYSFSMLEAFIDEAERQGVKKYPVHIKINTGMSRLGFELDEADELIKRLKAKDALLVRSVFSHFVGSDEERFDDFTEEQVRRFKSVADKFDKAFDHKVLRHILNSAGIERFPQYQFDMVRLGIGHYGFSAVDNSRLEEACTLKTVILQIRKVPASETVSYCRNGKLAKDSVIGAIPIGYADGLDRHLGNRAYSVMVNGKLVPIVGNICMDVCMIDLTGVDAKEGDVVTIFGKGHSIMNMAKQLGTISYEILTSVSPRVRRVYYQE